MFDVSCQLPVVSCKQKAAVLKIKLMDRLHFYPLPQPLLYEAWTPRAGAAGGGKLKFTYLDSLYIQVFFGSPFSEFYPYRFWEANLARFEFYEDICKVPPVV